MKTVELQDIKRRYNIVGNCDALNRALDVAIQVASTDLSVLIEGESGVGKEIIPRVIHDLSPRQHERYFAVNCGSIPEGTIDSELFGHEKGAFTGAIGESEGYFGLKFAYEHRGKNMSFDAAKCEDRVKELTARAKEGNNYTMDCDIGEAAYLETLIVFIKEWQNGQMKKDTLIKKQKELESKLLSYYQHREMFDRHIQINNRYSHILTEAEKSGCPICKKLVRIFDGRE